MVWLSLILSLLISWSTATGQAQSVPLKDPAPSQDTATILQTARNLRAQHRPNEAAARLEKYLTRHATDAIAMALLAQIDFDRGDKNTAQRLLGQALNADPDSVAVNRIAGTTLLEQNQLPQAMDRWETLLTILPHDNEAQQMEWQAASKLAAQAQDAGNEEAALTVFEHVYEKMPDHPEVLLALGMAAFHLHKLAEAEKALQEGRHLAPNDPDIVYGLARVEIDQQHMVAAEVDLRSYLAVRPQDASAHYGLGHVFAMEQRTEEARAEFERSIELQPVQTESYYQVGEIDLNAQQYRNAEALFRKVIDRDPNHGGALAGMGEIAFRAKNYPAAKDYLERAEKAAPDYAPAHYYRGLVLARLGRKEESDAELRLAAQLGHDAGVPAQVLR